MNCVQMTGDTDPWGLAYRVLASRMKAETPLVSLNVEGNTIEEPSEIVKTMLKELLPDDDINQDNEHH